MHNVSKINSIIHERHGSSTIYQLKITMPNLQPIFASFPAQSKKDWESLVYNELDKLKYRNHGIEIDAYVTIEDNEDKAELWYYNQLMQKSTLETALLFENPTYKTILITEDTSLTTAIQLFLERNQHAQDVHYYGFEIHLDEAYLFQIAKIRALRMLMLRLWPCIDSMPNVIVPVFTKIIYNPALAEHQNMIPITYQLMVSILANVNGIMVGNAFPHSTTRLIQNAYQILVNESGIFSLKDVAGGSYFIDQLTNKLIAETWDNLSQIYPLNT
jgi:hypothetical protein